MGSKNESDMDLIILVERKKILIMFLSVISQLCDFFCCVLTFFLILIMFLSVISQF